MTLNDMLFGLLGNGGDGGGLCGLVKGTGAVFLIVVGIILIILFGVPAILMLPPLIIVFICLWTLAVLIAKSIKDPSDPQIWGDAEHPALIRFGIAVGCIIIGALCSWWFWSVLTNYLN